MAKRKSCKLPTRKSQTITISAHGKTLMVKRTAAQSWFLRVEGERRGRFADLKSEACSDIAHFREMGSLPRGGVWW